MIEISDYLTGRFINVHQLARDTRPHRVGRHLNSLVHWKAEWRWFRPELNCSWMLERWVHHFRLKQQEFLGERLLLSMIGYAKYRLAVRAYSKVNGLPQARMLKP